MYSLIFRSLHHGPTGLILLVASLAKVQTLPIIAPLTINQEVRLSNAYFAMLEALSALVEWPLVRVIY